MINEVQKELLKMLELKISLDNVDYMTVVRAIIPLVVKNKLMAGAAITAANIKMRAMSRSEQEKYAAAFLTDHKDKIKELLNSTAKNKGISGEIIDFGAQSL